MLKLQLIGAGVRSICIFLDKLQSVVRGGPKQGDGALCIVWNGFLKLRFKYLYKKIRADKINLTARAFLMEILICSPLFRKTFRSVLDFVVEWFTLATFFRAARQCWL